MKPVPELDVEVLRPPHPCSSLYIGRLMHPDEVAAQMRTRLPHEAERVGRRWFFCGDVHASMFELLKDVEKPPLYRVTGFRSSLGGTYGVLTHQLQQHQHRLLLPLYDAGIQQALRAMQHDDHGFLLGNDGAPDAAVLSSAVSSQELLPLLTLGLSAADQDRRDLLLELPFVVSTLTAPHAIPGLMGADDAELVSLTVLMPTWVGAQSDRQSPTLQ